MKKAIFVTLLCCALALCGCAKKEKNNTAPDDSNVIYVSDTSQKPLQNQLIERKASSEVSAPDGSISFEQACKMADTCGIEPFYIAQSMKDYKKYYFGTITYKGEQYYSIYPYLDINGKQIFLGTNVLVSCSGNAVLAQNWMGGYEAVDQNTADLDKDWNTRCPDASISPNEALKQLVEKESSLGLKHSISTYTFEVDPTLAEIDGLPCYVYTPKLEYTDHIELFSRFYVSADGQGHIFTVSPDDAAEHIEIK